jgi:hypothetical protein
VIGWMQLHLVVFIRRSRPAGGLAGRRPRVAEMGRMV